MKTKEELNAIKVEIETISEKLGELTEEELNQVTGGYKEVGGIPSPFNDITIGNITGAIGKGKLGDVSQSDLLQSNAEDHNVML